MDVLFHKIYTLIDMGVFYIPGAKNALQVAYPQAFGVVHVSLVMLPPPPRWCTTTTNHHRVFLTPWLAPRIFGDFEFAMTTFGSKASTSPSVGWGFFVKQPIRVTVRNEDISRFYRQFLLGSCNHRKENPYIGRVRRESRKTVEVVVQVKFVNEVIPVLTLI